MVSPAYYGTRLTGSQETPKRYTPRASSVFQTGAVGANVQWLSIAGLVQKPQI